MTRSLSLADVWWVFFFLTNDHLLGQFGLWMYYITGYGATAQPCLQLFFRWPLAVLQQIIPCGLKCIFHTDQHCKIAVCKTFDRTPPAITMVNYWSFYCIILHHGGLIFVKLFQSPESQSFSKWRHCCEQALYTRLCCVSETRMLVRLKQLLYGCAKVKENWITDTKASLLFHNQCI